MEYHRMVVGPAVLAVSFATATTFRVLGRLTRRSETKGKTLEELDQVFSVPTHVHAAYGLRQIPYFFNRYFLRRNVQPEILYQREDEDVSDEA